MERHKSVKLEKKTTPLLSKNTLLCLDYFTNNLWEASDYFKSNEMGKLSSSGRAVDWTSKVAQRWFIDLGMAFVVGCVVVKNIYIKYGFLKFPSSFFLWELQSADIFVFTGRHCDTTVWLFMISLTISGLYPPRFARYKAQMAEEAKKLCEKYNVTAKGSQAINRWLLELLGFPLTLFLR